MSNVHMDALAIRRENRDKHLSLVHSQEEAGLMAKRLIEELKIVTAQVREHRRDISALERLKDIKAEQLHAILRSIAREPL